MNAPRLRSPDNPAVRSPSAPAGCGDDVRGSTSLSQHNTRPRARARTDRHIDAQHWSDTRSARTFQTVKKLSAAVCASARSHRPFKHLLPWFKVRAKVRIHRAGMVQPSAFRFLPTVPLSREDTINSSRLADWNWNPL